MAILTARTKKAQFNLNAPSAKKVTVAGSFNKWNITADSLKKSNGGNWTISLSLKPGRYEYKYLVDGGWVNDPACNSCVPNNYGSCNCVIDVK